MTSFCRLAVVSLIGSALLGSVQAQAIKRIEQADFGKTQDGSVVTLITLRNSKGMSAQIITYGAIIKGLRAPDRSGTFANVLLTTDTLEKFQQRFRGAAAVIGRVANRIKGARFELDGVTYRLTPNSGKNSIHGGPKGFAQSVWTVAGAASTPEEASVKLTYLSKDGEEGFPGNLTTSVPLGWPCSRRIEEARRLRPESTNTGRLSRYRHARARFWVCRDGSRPLPRLVGFCNQWAKRQSEWPKSLLKYSCSPRESDLGRMARRE